MTDRPSDAELAAIAAAYAIVMRAHSAATLAAPPTAARWPLAARIELDDATDARAAARRSPWRSAVRP